MLQAINDRSKGIVGGIIVFFLSITFASWGIQEYLTGSKEKNAASINGTDISVREYEDAVGKQRQRYQSIFGANMPTDAAFESKMKQQVLDQLVLQRVLNQTVESNHYRISNKTLAEKLQAIDAFKVDGKFSSATYQQTLAGQGMTSADFEQLYRRDLMAAQLQSGIDKSVILPDKTIQRYDQLQNQIRNVHYVVFNNAKTTSEIAVTDEDVQSYFTKNQSRYQHPEQVSISYIELKAGELTGGHINVEASIDEEQLRTQYNEYVAALSSKEERKVSHILVKVDATANAQLKDEAKKKITNIQEQLKSGKAFGELAKQYSDDTLSAKQGGDLGWISKGMTDAAFEQKLFTMNKKGDVSDVVETTFGYHIIQLDEIKSAKADTFEAKKVELIKTAQQQEIDNQFYDKSERLATLVYENDQALQPAAEALGLNIQNTGLFTQAGGIGVAANEAVRKAVFSEAVLKEGRNSEVIELARNHVLVLRINEHQPAKPMTLEEVKPFVVMAVKTEKAQQKIMATGLQAMADAKAGKSLDSIAKEYQGELIKLGDIKRTHSGADARVVQTAFSMSRPASQQASYDTVEIQNGIALIAVNSISNTQDVSRPEELLAAASLLEGDIAEQEMTAVLNYLKSQSDIVMATDLF